MSPRVVLDHKGSCHVYEGLSCATQTSVMGIKLRRVIRPRGITLSLCRGKYQLPFTSFDPCGPY